MPTEMLSHSYLPEPVYQLFVYARPSNQGKSREAYVEAVKSEGRQRITHHLDSFDVEVSMLYSSLRPGPLRIDIDNTLKPTLDALCGVAFEDDRQVRAVTARLIDRTNGIDIGHEGTLGRLLLNPLLQGGDDVVIIHIYSDTRLEQEGRVTARNRILAETVDENNAIRCSVLGAGTLPLSAADFQGVVSGKRVKPDRR